jgi:hypothetical protein
VKTLKIIATRHEQVLYTLQNLTVTDELHIKFTKSNKDHLHRLSEYLSQPEYSLLKKFTLETSGNVLDEHLYDNFSRLPFANKHLMGYRQTTLTD